MKTLTTSLKLPKTLHDTLMHRVIRDGYGMRGKSRWILEAIASFLTLSDYPALVDIATELDQLGVMMSLRLSDDVHLALDGAILRVRQIYPTLEGVKSHLIRASILQRLIRGSDANQQ